MEIKYFCLCVNVNIIHTLLTGAQTEISTRFFSDNTLFVRVFYDRHYSRTSTKSENSISNTSSVTPAKDIIFSTIILKDSNTCEIIY